VIDRKRAIDRAEGSVALQDVEGWSRDPAGRVSTLSFPPPQWSLSPGVAVAVCTNARPRELQRFLESLEKQEATPAQLIIVDASRDDQTERVVRRRSAGAPTAGECLYLRVSGSRRGLTRQRNVALRMIKTDLVAFFDDDIVLLQGCLREMEQVHRLRQAAVVGVGAFIENEVTAPTLRWRFRVRARVVPNLEPGRYRSCGMSTPWTFLEPTDQVVEGDWLRGGATMWRTAEAKECGFYENFGGYGLGEDLEFSLRMRQHGALVLAGSARALHLHSTAGRPDPFRRGYMEIRNRYQIHRSAERHLDWRDRAWFVYVWTLDTLVLGCSLFVPTRMWRTLLNVAGRFKAAFDLVRGGV
jgi:GT2 family glycosyltransferase